MTETSKFNRDRADRHKANRGKSLTGRTISGAMWTTIGTGAEYVLHALIFVIMARLLGPEDFGVFAIAMVVVGLSKILGEVGLGPALVQRGDLDVSHIRAAFTSTVVLGLVMTLVIGASAPVIAVLVGDGAVAPVIRLLSILFLIRAVGTVAGYLLQRELRLATLAKANLLAYVVGYGILGVSLAYLGLGYWALVWAAICEATIKSVYMLFVSSHSKRPQIRWEPLKDLLSFGVGFSMGRLGNYLAMKGDYLVVGRFLGVAPLGIYSRAYELMAMPVGLYQTVANKVFFSAVSVVQGDKVRLSRAHARTTALIAVVLLPCSILLCVLAPELIELVLGARWEGVVAPFQVIAIGMYFRSGYTMSEAVAKGTGHVHALAVRQGIYAGLVFIGAWSGHHFGVTGVAAGVLIAMILHFAMVTNLGLRASGLSLREFISCQIPAVILGGLVLVLSMVSAWALRSEGTSPWITLLGASLFCASVVFVLIRYVPETIGSHGDWAISSVKQYLRSKRERRSSTDVIRVTEDDSEETVGVTASMTPVK